MSYIMIYMLVHNRLYTIIYILIHSMPRFMKVQSMYNTMEMGTSPGLICSCAIWNVTEPLASHARMCSPFSSSAIQFINCSCMS